jgi:hypothetical protein
MESRTCPACDRKLAGYENGPECDGCSSQPFLRCGKCGKKTQVQNGKEFCPKCEPLLCRLVRKSNRGRHVVSEGPDVDRLKTLLFEEVAAEEYSRSRVTLTLWTQTYYGPKLKPGRIWAKTLEVELQGAFKDVAGNYSENP